MKRVLAIVAAVTFVISGFAYVAAQNVPADDGPSVNPGSIESLRGDIITPTAWDSLPTPPVEPTTTATSIPTSTAEPTQTPAEAAHDPSKWHPPADHEHGDPPPQWAESWSIEHFGHGVIYGGEGSTPGENEYKHNAFKGFSWTTTADDGRPVDLYLRLHMQTNPLGRSAQFHSYEFYAGRDGEVLGFWQGWLDFGPSPEHRDSYADDPLWRIIPRYEPANHIVGFGPDGNPYYRDGHSGREFWYAQQSTPGGWDPVIFVDVFDPSTYFVSGEATERETWLTTGDYGLERRVNLRWIVEGSDARTVSGQPYLQRNMENPRGWFCATPFGEIISMGTANCGDELPQYISVDMPTIGDTGEITQYADTWECPECSLPN